MISIFLSVLSTYILLFFNHVDNCKHTIKWVNERKGRVFCQWTWMFDLCWNEQQNVMPFHFISLSNIDLLATIGSLTFITSIFVFVNSSIFSPLTFCLIYFSLFFSFYDEYQYKLEYGMNTFINLYLVKNRKQPYRINKKKTNKERNGGIQRNTLKAIINQTNATVLAVFTAHFDCGFLVIAHNIYIYLGWKNYTLKKNPHSRNIFYSIFCKLLKNLIE